MFRQIFGNRPTTKTDVVLGFAAAALAVVHAIGIKRQFEAEQADNQKENQK